MQYSLKPYIQYQKPQLYMLGTLAFPLLTGIFNFGWRVALVTAWAMFVAWATEYAFTRREGKPASTAALVTGALLALILPPNIPFWQITVGCVFALVFGKMVFGGFGCNIFNPAMVGRCFLYVCFPATVAAAWYAPFTTLPGGFIEYSPDVIVHRTREIDASLEDIDAVTSATVLTATKRLNQVAFEARARGDETAVAKSIAVYENIPFARLFLGNINGSVGETSSLAILLALAFLLYHKIVAIPLVIGPLLGLLLGKLLLKGLGFELMPLGSAILVAFFGGGTMFACTFMTTEPISAPMNTTARWFYGILIGFLAVLIRGLSVFNAGLMFSILLGNTFGPLIEIGVNTWEKRGQGGPKA